MKTTGDPDPREVIGAIMVGDSLSLTGHLGTGSFIGDGTVVLTNEHVIRDETEQLFIAVIIGGKPVSFPLTVLEADPDRDLALLKVNGYTAPDSLHVLFDTPVSYNTDLVVLEYAQTFQLKDTRFFINPAGRRGNRTRRVVRPDVLGPIVGQDAWELSIPSLAGASGAPVLIEQMPWTPPGQGWGIVGVLSANTLLDASVLAPGEPAMDFKIPQGLAVDINHLKPLYKKVFGNS